MSKPETRNQKPENRDKIKKILFLKSPVFYILVSVLWFLFSIAVVNCFAGAISSEDLIQNAKEYDGKEVTFRGEAIGDVMKRGNFYWINILDAKNAIGVFSDKSVFDGIIFTGDYNHKGDIVEVSGIFHRACLEHGGDLDIHVSKMTRLRDGYKVIHNVNQLKVKIILWLAPVLLGLIAIMIIGRVRKER